MKKFVLLLFAIMLIMQGNVFSQPKSKPLTDTVSAISRVQSYLEFYYMNTGNYPKTLQELDRIFNEGLQKESDRVVIPLEPGVSKSFLYKPSADLKSYVLSVNDASVYGLESFELKSVPWGWMSLVASDINMAAKTDLCRRYMEGIIMGVKAYQEKEKKLPTDIKDLVPGYFKAVPVCPQCAKPYILTKSADDLVISCPEPQSHLLKVYRYSLRKGAEKSQ